MWSHKSHQGPSMTNLVDTLWSFVIRFFSCIWQCWWFPPPCNVLLPSSKTTPPVPFGFQLALDALTQAPPSYLSFHVGASQGSVLPQPLQMTSPVAFHSPFQVHNLIIPFPILLCAQGRWPLKSLKAFPCPLVSLWIWPMEDQRSESGKRERS